MSTLYVTETGARIEIEYRHILVTKDDEVLARAMLGHISHVVLVGNVGATTPALLALLDNGIGLSMIGQGGRLRGRLSPPLPRNAPLRKAQYRLEEDGEFCQRFAVAGGMRQIAQQSDDDAADYA